MSDPAVLADHIRATWFGSDLPDASLLRLGAMAREYESPARTRLLREGDDTKELSILVDGRIVDGTAFVRETPFTGEWISATRTVGDPVIAATACEDGPLTVEVRGGELLEIAHNVVDRTFASGIQANVG